MSQTPPPSVKACGCGRGPREGHGWSCRTCRAEASKRYRMTVKRENPVQYRRLCSQRGFFKMRAIRVNHSRRKTEGRVTAGQLLKLWWDQRGLCALTGERLSRRWAHLDHKVPVSRGGTNEISNLRWTVPGANLAKGDKLDWEAQCGPEDQLPF